MPYTKLLISAWYKRRKPIPLATRQAVLERAQRRCEGCGDDKVRLEMHHVTYAAFDRGEPSEIFGQETPDDLKALCRYCHQAEHVDVNGEFWADPEDKENYWSGFDDKMERD